MKLITLTFFTFIRAVLLYLFFTLPVAGQPKIYCLSVVVAFVLGVAAWLVFMAFSFIMRVLKVPVATTNILLYAAVFIAVLAAYSALLAYAVKGMHFWNIQLFTLYPAAAIIAGWISLYVNRRRLKNYFSPVKRVPMPVFYLHPDKFHLN